MSMQDPISDMLTCIRNAQKCKKLYLSISFSFFKESIIKIFFEEGFICGYKILKKNLFKNILIELKYYSGIPVIKEIIRVSSPSLRVYKSCKNLPLIMSGLGVVVISTSKGVISDRKARKLNIGGEIICYIL